MIKLFFGVSLVSLVWCAISTSVIPWPPKKISRTQYLDHFSNKTKNFIQVTLYEDKYWNQKGPILFYCGHEKPINYFWNNTGFIFEYARDVKGFVIFAEHRYYGKSKPFYNIHLDKEKWQYLSIKQVLRDYVKVLTDYRTSFNISVHIPVIAFGGGYGGILAGLMRLYFPNVVEGALVSSAPFMWLARKGHLSDMFKSITKVYDEINSTCSKIIKDAYAKIYGARGDALKNISKTMKTCRVLFLPPDVLRLLEWSRNAFVAMATMNYPYRSNFLHNMPPAPLNASCEKISKYDKSKVVEGLRDAVGVYYNSTGKLKCFDIFEYKPCASIYECGVGSDAFDYQTCTEMQLYDSISYTNGSMFPNISLSVFEHMPSSFIGLSLYCRKKFGINSIFSNFSQKYSDGNFSITSNIIFSNGYLDPWRLGGILQNVSQTVVAFNIFGGAHHYDLRESNSNDSASVVDVRRRQRLVMKKWIKNFKPKNNF